MKLYPEEAYAEFFAYTFMQGNNHRKKGTLEDDLANQFAMGINSYPCDLQNATTIIIINRNYINNQNNPGKKRRNQRKIHRKIQTKK